MWIVKKFHDNISLFPQGLAQQSEERVKVDIFYDKHFAYFFVRSLAISHGFMTKQILLYLT